VAAAPRPLRPFELEPRSRGRAGAREGALETRGQRGLDPAAAAASWTREGRERERASSARRRDEGGRAWSSSARGGTAVLASPRPPRSSSDSPALASPPSPAAGAPPRRAKAHQPRRGRSAPPSLAIARLTPPPAHHACAGKDERKGGGEVAAAMASAPPPRLLPRAELQGAAAARSRACSSGTPLELSCRPARASPMSRAEIWRRPERTSTAHRGAGRVPLGARGHGACRDEEARRPPLLRAPPLAEEDGWGGRRPTPHRRRNHGEVAGGAEVQMRWGEERENGRRRKRMERVKRKR
jgi:hypothetical protein